MPEHTIAENLTRLQNAKTAIGNAITAKGGTVAAGDGLEDFASDIATITNQYSAADEGKVVSNGALIAQTAYPSTITENGTYNTTENNSVTVNVDNGLDGLEITKLTLISPQVSGLEMYAANITLGNYVKTVVFGKYDTTSISIDTEIILEYPETFTFKGSYNAKYYLYLGKTSSNANYGDGGSYYSVNKTNRQIKITNRLSTAYTPYMLCYMFA